MRGTDHWDTCRYISVLLLNYGRWNNWENHLIPVPLWPLNKPSYEDHNAVWLIEDPLHFLGYMRKAPALHTSFFLSSSQSMHFYIWGRIAWMRYEEHWAPYSYEIRCVAPLGNIACWVSVSKQTPEIQELSSVYRFTQIYSNSSTDWSVGKVSKWILCCFKALLALSWGQWLE